MAISKATEAVVIEAGVNQPPRFTAVRAVWEFFRKWPVIPAVILLGLIVMAIVAPWLAPYDYAETDLLSRNAPGFWDSQWYRDNPQAQYHILGSDPFGRDILSRIMHGARVSLLISAMSIAIGMTVGTALGLAAGYYGKVVDEVISRFVDIWLSLPFILIALIATIIFEPGLKILLILLSLLAWSVFVRNIRAEALSLRERDYVNQARIAGASDIWIIWKHLLPGVVNTIIVIATLRVGQLILAEATLSYLGAGLPSPTPAWGLMVSEGREYLRLAWWSTFFPGVSIVLLVMALNFLGDWSRDRFDPRLRQLS
jgi:peptide/nickel transport system permease protein